VAALDGVDANVLKLSNPNLSPQDLDGDGVVDLLHMPRGRDYAVFTPRKQGTSWRWVGRPVTTASKQDVKIDFTHDAFNTRVMDVNGDGLVDVVFSSATEMQTFFALGRYPGGDGQFGQATWTGASSAAISNQPVTSCVPWKAQAVRLGDGDIRVADMNGDGLPDIVRLRAGDISYWPGRGNGFWGTGNHDGCTAGTYGQNRHVAMANGAEFGVTEGSSLLLEDVNGDGLADIVKVRFDAVDIWLNVDGAGWTDRYVIDNVPVRPPSRDYARLIDINGSGTADILWAQASNYQYIDLQGGARSGVLTRVSNGFGKTTELEYTTSTALMLKAAHSGQAWTATSPAPVHVVSRVKVRDNLERVGRAGGAIVTEYGYRDAVYDGRQREFRGFAQAEARTLGDANSPTSIARSYFLLGECKDEVPGDGIDVCATSERWRDHGREPLKGLPVRTEQVNEAAEYLQTGHTTYTLRRLFVGLDGREVRHAFASRNDTYLYDTGSFVAEPSTVALDDVLLERTLGTVTPDTSINVPLASTSGRAHLVGRVTLDAFGNQLSHEARGCVDGCASIDEAISSFSTPYRPAGDTSGWLYLLRESWITGSRRPEEIRNHARFEHNRFGDPVRKEVELLGSQPLERFHQTPGAEGQGPTGVVSDGWFEAARYNVDAFGQMVQSIGAEHRCESTEYDADYAQLITKATVYAGALNATTSCGAVALETRGIYDRGFSVALETTNAQGELSRATLDTFGRVVASWDPDPNTLGQVSPVASDRYEYYLPTDAVPVARIHHLEHDDSDPNGSGYHEEWTYTDGLGRTIVEIVEADPIEDGAGWITRGLVDYDAKGAVRRAYLPEYDSGDASQYALSVPPAGPYVSERFDAFGRSIEKKGLDGGVVARVVHHALGQDTSDAADVGPSVHQNTPTTETIDGHGRTIATIERFRNAGVIEERHALVEYLPTGEVRQLIRRRVASGAQDPDVVRWLGYDSLGRRILNVEPNTSANFYADPDALPPAGFHAWRYAYNKAGELIGTSDARGCGQNFLYDAGGRLIGEDDSPCRNSQPAYSAPVLTPGAEANLEVFYRYDASDPAAPNPTDSAGRSCVPNAATSKGRLVSIADQATLSVTRYDGRGRSACTAKRLAKPGAVAGNLATRYAPRWYVRQIDYDDADRAIRATTGSSVPELAGAGGQSAVTTSYAKGGRVRAVAGSYGTLVGKVQRTANGLLLQANFGDVAETKRAYTYDERLRVANAQTFRGAPNLWSGGSSNYFPPAAGDPPTRQLLLEDSDFTYDEVDNITEIRDFRMASEWEAGSKPVTTRYQYDDLYRLTQVDYEYPAGTDAWRSPFAAEDADANRKPRPAPRVNFSNRVLRQQYQYDWLGNVARTDDDAAGFYDRSLGVVANGASGSVPYQLRSASNRAPAGPGGPRAGDLDARYDDAGHLTDLMVRRDGPCLPAAASCWQRFRYEWDEVGRLASARRWDLTAGERSTYGALSVEPPSRAPDAWLVYTYDAGNGRVRKTGIDPAGQERHTLYVYSSLELRSTAWLAGATTPDYALDSQVETVYLDGGLVTARVVMVLADIPSQTSGRQRVLLELGDHLGSSSIVIDRETSEVVERETYEAYGATESDYRPARWASFRESYKFTGKEEDIEVGLQYFGERYYAPALNRWISADPLTIHGLGADLNAYAYVHGSVVNAVDPDGQHPLLAVIGAAALIGAAWGAGSAAVMYAGNGGNLFSWGALAAVTTGAIGGAAHGALFTVGMASGMGPVAAQTMAGYGSGLLTYYVSQTFQGGPYDAGDALSAGLQGAAWSFGFAVVGQGVSQIGSNSGSRPPSKMPSSPPKIGPPDPLPAGPRAPSSEPPPVAPNGPTPSAPPPPSPALKPTAPPVGTTPPSRPLSTAKAPPKPAPIKLPLNSDQRAIEAARSGGNTGGSTGGKPSFQPNPAHTPGQPGFNRGKTIEPGDSAKVYENAIQGKDGNWYGQGGNGQIYRYFPDNTGGAHFSGMTGRDKGIPLDRIPIGVRRVFGMVR
ncbi:MAG TPA: toxin TcdB middle/N-terminal domain-containing protein, partial [Polyangiaceae bacterium]|nr:toxin TcdB middle/N-terminal domain-containing protein [Polyangiaceae bacterium]